MSLIMLSNRRQGGGASSGSAGASSGGGEPSALWAFQAFEEDVGGQAAGVHTYTTETHDPDGISNASTGAITIPATGRAFLFGSTLHHSTVTGSRNVYLRKGGATRFRSRIQPAAALEWENPLMWIGEVAASDGWDVYWDDTSYIYAARNRGIGGVGLDSDTWFWADDSSGSVSVATNTVIMPTAASDSDPGAYDTSTGVWTVPRDGLYLITASLFTSYATYAGITLEIQIDTGGGYSSAYARSFSYPNMTGHWQCPVAKLAQLSAGDKVRLVSGTTTWNTPSAYHNAWGAIRVPAAGAFEARPNTGSLSAGITAFGNSLLDNGSDFNFANGRYEAASDQLMLFYWQQRTSLITGVRRAELVLNSSVYASALGYRGGGGTIAIPATSFCVMPLSNGDVVEYQADTVGINDSDGYSTRWGGVRIG